MATVTGKLQDVLTAVEDGSVEIALCGYGGRVPRQNGIALFGSTTSDDIDVQPDGTFTKTVAGNDTIAPAGTYYTVTVKDENGDVVQVNAYRFVGNTSYDLNITDPYDPNQDPPPLPPLITNLLQIVAIDGGAPRFDGQQYTAWKIVLTQDVGGAYLTGLVPGNLYTFIIVQDGVGGHTFLWPSGPPPANLHNPTMVSPTPNSTTVQTFICDESSDLWAIGPGTWSA
jgi:hypothetical protein